MIVPIWEFQGLGNCGCVGYMRYSRCELESCFGTPHNTLEGSDIVEDAKVNYEWWFDINDNVVTIYDYKEYRDVPEDEPILWHIGGRDYGVVLAIQNLGFDKAVTRPEYLEQIENIYGHIEVRKTS